MCFRCVLDSIAVWNEGCIRVAGIVALFSCRSVLCCFIHTVMYCAVRCCTFLHCTWRVLLTPGKGYISAADIKTLFRPGFAPCCAVLYCSVQYCTLQHCAALSWTARYCTVLNSMYDRPACVVNHSYARSAVLQVS